MPSVNEIFCSDGFVSLNIHKLLYIRTFSSEDVVQEGICELAMLNIERD
jgi:hypothetical protein